MTTHPDDASPLTHDLDDVSIHSASSGRGSAADTPRFNPGPCTILLAVAAEFSVTAGTAAQWMREIDWSVVAGEVAE